MTSRQDSFYTELQGLGSSLLSLPCTSQQYDACQAAWRRLVEESWDEQALSILRTLVIQAQNQSDNWDWLTAELYFEAYAHALDDRAQAALHFLRLRPTVTDEVLDRYNQRLQRFCA